MVGLDSGLNIVPVQTRGQWNAFHRLPHRIYRDDPSWVPPLLLERKLHFSPKHNPFFQHARAEFWLAYKDGEPVGRISAQIDPVILDLSKRSTTLAYSRAFCRRRRGGFVNPGSSA
jgi:hypothetical protein